jgi:hypothetical protein
MHTDSHPAAGETVILSKAKDPHRNLVEAGEEFRIEDWWDKLTGQSWMTSEGNPAALMYAFRAGMAGLPVDDEVVYGKIGPYGHLVHVSEL